MAAQHHYCSVNCTVRKHLVDSRYLTVMISVYSFHKSIFNLNREITPSPVSSKGSIASCRYQQKVVQILSLVPCRAKNISLPRRKSRGGKEHSLKIINPHRHEKNEKIFNAKWSMKNPWSLWRTFRRPRKAFRLNSLNGPYWGQPLCCRQFLTTLRLLAGKRRNF